VTIVLAFGPLDDDFGLPEWRSQPRHPHSPQRYVRYALHTFTTRSPKFRERDLCVTAPHSGQNWLLTLALRVVN
jgi:hypothetical protein